MCIIYMLNIIMIICRVIIVCIELLYMYVNVYVCKLIDIFLFFYSIRCYECIYRIICLYEDYFYLEILIIYFGVFNKMEKEIFLVIEEFLLGSLGFFKLRLFKFLFMCRVVV